MKLKLVTHPDKRLKKKSTDLPGVTDSTRALASTLAKLMMNVGLTSITASQVGIMKRLCVIYDPRFGLIAMINPVITEQEGEIMVPVSCASFPGKAAVCYRPEKLKARYLTIEGKEMELEFDGQAAAAIHHAVDVLNGVTIVDRNRITQKRFKDLKKAEQEKTNEIGKNEAATEGDRNEATVFTDFGDASPYIPDNISTNTQS